MPPIEDDFSWIPNTPYYEPKTHRQIKEHMELRFPWRWRRLQKDFEAIQKEMKRLGLNPEDARYLL